MEVENRTMRREGEIKWRVGLMVLKIKILPVYQSGSYKVKSFMRCHFFFILLLKNIIQCANFNLDFFRSWNFASKSRIWPFILICL